MISADMATLISCLDRIATALERFATEKTTKPTDTEILAYMQSFGENLPPVRTIAKAVGWSHSYVLSLPLSGAYFKRMNGLGVRASSRRSCRSARRRADDEGNYDE